MGIFDNVFETDIKDKNKQQSFGKKLETSEGVQRGIFRKPMSLIISPIETMSNINQNVDHTATVKYDGLLAIRSR